MVWPASRKIRRLGGTLVTGGDEHETVSRQIIDARKLLACVRAPSSSIQVAWRGMVRGVQGE